MVADVDIPLDSKRELATEEEVFDYVRVVGDIRIWWIVSDDAFIISDGSGGGIMGAKGL